VPGPQPGEVVREDCKHILHPPSIALVPANNITNTVDNRNKHVAHRVDHHGLLFVIDTIYKPMVADTRSLRKSPLLLRNTAHRHAMLRPSFRFSTKDNTKPTLCRVETPTACEATCHFQTVSSIVVVSEETTLGISFPSLLLRLKGKLRSVRLRWSRCQHSEWGQRDRRGRWAHHWEERRE
jgi:hypothetical protein